MTPFELMGAASHYRQTRALIISPLIIFEAYGTGKASDTAQHSAPLRE